MPLPAHVLRTKVLYSTNKSCHRSRPSLRTVIDRTCRTCTTYCSCLGGGWSLCEGEVGGLMPHGLMEFRRETFAGGGCHRLSLCGSEWSHAAGGSLLRTGSGEDPERARRRTKGSARAQAGIGSASPWQPHCCALVFSESGRCERRAACSRRGGWSPLLCHNRRPNTVTTATRE